jgi:hypothetical protein
LKLEHPDKADMIDAWFGRFDEMMAGPITGTVDILTELREREVPLYALSNWSAGTFPFAQRRFEFLQWFRVIFLGWFAPDGGSFGQGNETSGRSDCQRTTKYGRRIL